MRYLVFTQNVTTPRNRYSPPNAVVSINSPGEIISHRKQLQRFLVFFITRFSDIFDSLNRLHDPEFSTCTAVPIKSRPVDEFGGFFIFPWGLLCEKQQWLREI